MRKAPEEGMTTAEYAVGHHTARLLENNTWADNAINDADRTRINDH